MKHASQPLPNPKKFCPNLASEVFSLLKKMTAKERAHRFQSYEQLIAELENTEKLLNKRRKTSTIPKNIHKNTKNLHKNTHKSSKSPRSRSSKTKKSNTIIYPLIAGAAAILILLFALSNKDAEKQRKRIAKSDTQKKKSTKK